MMRKIRNRSSRRCSKHNVPPEVWAEILSYLPAKSLLRFRSVSKTWKSIIEDPDFASLHLKRCPNSLLESHLILLEMPCRKKEQWVLRRSDTFRKTSEVEFPDDGCGPALYEWAIVGASNELLLLKMKLGWWKLDDVILWNPSIRKSVCVPRPPSLHPTGFHKVSDFELCLGFDPSINDYKVVVIVYPGTFSKPIPPSSVEIFSLKSRSWRRVVGCGGARCVRETYRKKLSFGGMYTLDCARLSSGQCMGAQVLGFV